MRRGRTRQFSRIVVATALLLSMVLVDRPAAFATTFTYDGILFSHSNYDYAPSPMFDGSTIKVWWCGYDATDPGNGDAIFYAEDSGSGWSAPRMVLTKSPTGWDSTHTCDPSVVKGSFSYNGASYTYAMYYSGTDQCCANTRIGVAFSNDGTTWVKDAANPIISPAGGTTTGYGAGMPTAYREDGTASSVYLAYWDSTVGSNGTNYVVHSTDGQTFSNRTTLPNPLYWEQIGDIAYSPSEGKWYIATKHANDQIVYLYKTADANLTSTWSSFG